MSCSDVKCCTVSSVNSKYEPLQVLCRFSRSVLELFERICHVITTISSELKNSKPTSDVLINTPWDKVADATKLKYLNSENFETQLVLKPVFILFCNKRTNPTKKLNLTKQLVGFLINGYLFVITG